ncbi:MAG TPA: amino acid adenylation domain-containing protein [Terriglobales bacterium]|nr:amino acid adenylation domain-containing protein [Terriglobales bacterium]
MSQLDASSTARQVLLDKYLRGEAADALRPAPASQIIKRRTTAGPAPLSFAQQQVWVHSQVSPGLPIYNEPFTVHRRGPLDIRALERALVEIVRRHEAWRTTFPEVEGRPVQLVHPAPENFHLPFADLRHLERDEREAQANLLATPDAQRPFDLAKGPLIRARLVQLADEDFRLYLTLHQIILDGVTAYHVLLPELAGLYEAFSAGRPSPLPELPFQHADYACWQHETINEQALAEHLAYWRERLKNSPPALNLPLDRPRPAEQTFSGAMHRLQIPKPLVEKVRRLSQENGATLFMGMLAGFYAVLQRYCGQDDLSIGSLTASRKGPGVEKLLGYFVNPVVLRTNLAGNPSFGELLQRVRETVLGALSHDEVPFEQLIRQTHPHRDSSRNPLFQIMMSLEPPMPEVDGWSMTQFDVCSGASKFDLYFDLDDRSEGIIGPVTYNPDLFEAGTIARLVGHWQELLKGAVSDPARPVAELPLLTAAEREQLVVQFNDTFTPRPETTLLDSFAACCQNRPDAVAAEDNAGAITYEALNARSNRLARHLCQMGVGPGVLVGICIDRSLDMVTALLAVLKAGGAYVPLDPSFPKQRLTYMAADAGLQVVLTQKKFAGLLGDDHAGAICIDRESDWASYPDDDLRARAKADDLAYVIYTSGSTGKPKGVEISHRSLLNLLLSMQQKPGLTSDDRLLAVTTLSFDIAGLELFLPLITGATLIIADGETTRDGARLAARISQSRTTVMQATPVTWRLLLQSGWKGNPALRIWCGGEALSRDLAEQLLPRCHSLWNLYGPTETTIWSAVCRVESGIGPVLIGEPVANTEFHVLDQRGELVPLGVPGELHIGGLGLARGYHNQPELTREKFVHSSIGSGRLYKTGDLVQRRSDGRLEFLGRIDNQLKVRGFRIEVGEIEAVLATHSAIKSAVVAARPDNSGELQLIAYPIASTDLAPTAEALRGFLRQSLPDYMLPAQFVFLDAFPVTPNGKIDRAALPGIFAAGGEKAPLSLPRTTTEQKLFEIWRELLAADRFSIGQSFFDLGGHSLLAAQLIARVEQTFAIRLSLGDVFRYPSVEAMSKFLQGHAQASSTSTRTIPALHRGEPSALSHGQQQIWLHSQMAPQLPLYNEAMALRWEGALDVEALERALNELVLRHSILRTAFFAIDGQPVQQVRDMKTNFPLRLKDLTGLGRARAEEEALRIAREDAQAPFDLSSGSPFRTLLIRLDESEYRLYLTLHHIVFDGLSIYGVLIPELEALYTAFTLNQRAALPELPIQYSDFAGWQNQRLARGELQHHLEYWRQRLGENLPTLPLPADRPRPAIQTFRGAMQSVGLSRELTESLVELAKRQGTTLHTVLLAGFQALLSAYSGQQDIVVGGVTSGRALAELHSLIGYFINVVVFRTDLSGNPSVTELLRRTQQTVLEALGHDEAPFDLVVNAVQPKRDPSLSPLVQVLFSFITPPAGRCSKWTVTTDLDLGVTKYDLHLELENRPEGVSGYLLYNTDIFDRSTVEEILAKWQSVLRTMAADDRARVADLAGLISPEPRKSGSAASDVRDSAILNPPTHDLEPRHPGPAELEKKLSGIWQGVLGVASVDVNDNFFDLGGHSLLAAKLAARIEQATQQSVTLSEVFQAPTVRQMSLLLASRKTATEFTGIIPIQPQGSNPPLFWIRGGALFLPMARRLGPNQLSFALHLSASEASRLGRRCTLEEIAGAFIRQLKQIQPDGPYHLAGLCVNGVLAYEMACQLVRAGDQVSLLVMIDTQNPVLYHDYSQESRSRVTAQLLSFHLQKLKSLRRRDVIPYLLDRYSGLRRRWNRIWWQLTFRAGWKANSNLADLDRLVHPAAARYRPGSYPGMVAFFHSTDWPQGEYWQLHLGWKDLVRGELEVERIEGEHESIFDEAIVEPFARKLMGCLTEARKKSDQTLVPC